MKVLTYLSMCIMCLSFVSCKKYLDVIPDNVGTIDYAFRNRNEAEKYLFTCYSTLQKLSNTYTNGGFTTSGEIIFPNDLRENDGVDTRGFNLIRGTQTTNEPRLNFWDGEEGGLPIYRAIRFCNIMLENIDKPVDLTAEEKIRWIAETKFLKAYYHFYLMRMYGPIPITDVNLPINADENAVRVKRQSVDQVVNYIVQLLDEATADLPTVITREATELGRITKLIALSVKADVLMTAASPLFNGNPDYTNFKDGEGNALISTQYDATKWDRAAEACLAAINLCEQSGLRLHTFNAPANIPSNLPAELRLILTQQTAVTEKWELNKELIWALNPTYGYGQQEKNMPRLNIESLERQIAQGTMAVPIAQQELFYTDKGLPINEDRTWNFNDRYKIKFAEAKDKYLVHEGYETINAHFNREARFYASIGFDGGVWYGNGQLDPDKADYVQAKGSGAYSGPKDINKTNIAAAWPKKLVNYLTVSRTEMTWEDFRLPLIRLAGLYLWYAEALNEQGRPYNTVLPYVDQVRARAGLPSVETAWTTYSTRPTKFTTKEGLREIIHRERRIELAFEGIAGWDLRRWKELQEVMNKPMQGWSIGETQAVNFYRPRTLINPVFNVRDYLWPLKDKGLIINPNLVQNPLW